MTSEEARQKLSDFAGRVGREVRVFVREAAVRRDEAEPSGEAASVDVSSQPEQTPPGAAEGAQAAAAAAAADEGDKFYEFTVADYARVMSSQKEEKFLKLRKHREQDLQERRSRIQKAVIRVLFPDGFVVESTFLPTDSVADIRALIRQCLVDQDAPFYFFTAPPKKRIKDETQDLYSAQLAPGALIHFGLEDSAKGAAAAAAATEQGLEAKSVLSEEVQSLRDLHALAEGTTTQHEGPQEPAQEVEAPPKPKPEPSSAGAAKKPGLPKWFKR